LELQGLHWELYQRQRTGFEQRQRSYHQDKNTAKETKQDHLEVKASATENSDKYQPLMTTDWDTNCPFQTLFDKDG
jgi:hypothetical protein